MTRKWKIVLALTIMALLATWLFASLPRQSIDSREHPAHRLEPMVREGTMRVTTAMRIALAASAVDYNAAVQEYKTNLFELEEQIQAVEALGQPSDRHITAALLYLKSAQSVVRELHRDYHTAQSLQNAQSRITEAHFQDAAQLDTLAAMQRQAWELAQDRKMTSGRLMHAARMFHKNILHYRATLGAEHLAPPEMVVSLMARSDGRPNIVR